MRNSQEDIALTEGACEQQLKNVWNSERRFKLEDMETMVEENGNAGNSGGDPLAPSPGEASSPAVTSVQNSQPPSLIAASPSTGVSIVHVTIPQPPSTQVQSVIQPNQQSVIQTAANIQPVQLSKGNVILVSKPNSVIQTTGGSLQTLQVVEATSDESLSNDDEQTKKRREILARRPSYRKILNDLGGGEIAEEKGESSSTSESMQDSELSPIASNHYQPATVIPAGTIQLASPGTQGDAVHGLHTLTMTNATTAGGAIVQYAQGQDGQFFVPVATATILVGTATKINQKRKSSFDEISVGGDLQAYTVRTVTSSSSLTPGVVVAPNTATTIQSAQQMAEEAARKRELRLLKNREAARECRRKKKEYIKCLENRVAVLENQNKALIDELKSLKELYCQQKTE